MHKKLNVVISFPRYVQLEVKGQRSSSRSALLTKYDEQTDIEQNTATPSNQATT